MMKMFLFFSHRLTQEQMEEAKGYGVEEFVTLPSDLQYRFSNVPPDLENLDDYVRPFLLFLFEKSARGDFVLVQGDFGLVHKIVCFSRSVGLVPLYATTERIAVEKEIEGKFVKVSQFKHVRFREY